MKLDAWRSRIGDEYADCIEEARLFDDEEIATVAFWDRDDEGIDLLRVLAAGERGIHDCSVRERPTGELTGAAVLVEWFDVRGVHLIEAPSWSTGGNRSEDPLRPLVGRHPRFLLTPLDGFESEAIVQFAACVRERAAFNHSPDREFTVEGSSP